MPAAHLRCPAAGSRPLTTVTRAGMAASLTVQGRDPLSRSCTVYPAAQPAFHPLGGAGETADILRVSRAAPGVPARRSRPGKVRR